MCTVRLKFPLERAPKLQNGTRTADLTSCMPPLCAIGPDTLAGYTRAKKKLPGLPCALSLERRCTTVSDTLAGYTGAKKGAVSDTRVGCTCRTCWELACNPFKAILSKTTHAILSKTPRVGPSHRAPLILA